MIAAEILAESIRANKEIVGIDFFFFLNKTSQYADDTSLYLEPSEKTLRACLITLKEFQKASGLRINIDKSKVVKIEGWRNSGIMLCPDLALHRTHEFEALGIKCNVCYMRQITEFNLEDNSSDILSLIRILTPRQLTLLGKIIVIKSLLISKITHILLSLPNPTPQILDKIDSILKIIME